MNNKYKDDNKLCIYLFPDYYSKLKGDAERFEIEKRAGEPNLNGLLCRIIRCYYETFFEKECEITEKIHKALSVLNLKDKEKAAVSEIIIKDIVRPESTNRDKIKRKKITLRPDAETRDLIDTIEKTHVGSSSISGYFTRMFASYCDLPMTKREQIVFKDNYDKLQKSLNSKVQKRIIFKTKNKSSYSHRVILYKIVTAKEEMFNYLLCSEINQETGEQTPKTYRLCRVTGITFEFGDTTINDSVKSRLEAMEQYPQYSIDNDEITWVRLTEEGVKNYKRIYYGRPEYISKSENIENGYWDYYFNCSQNQLFLYFRRLGCEAEVIKPEGLRNKLKKFYMDAAAIYEKE